MSDVTAVSVLSHQGMKPMFECDLIDYVFIGTVFGHHACDVWFHDKRDMVVIVWEYGNEMRPYQEPESACRAPDSLLDAADTLVTKWIEYQTGVALSRVEPLLDRG